MKTLLIIADSFVLGDALQRYFSQTFVVDQLLDTEDFPQPKVPYDRVLVVSEKIQDHLWQKKLTNAFLPAAIVCVVGDVVTFHDVPSYITLWQKPILLPALAHKLHEILMQPIPIDQLFFFPHKRLMVHPVKGQTGSLTEKECAVLQYLWQHKNTTVSKEQLLKTVWQYHPDITTHTLETHIYRLRKKLDVLHHPHLLRFDTGGYRLCV